MPDFPTLDQIGQLLDQKLDQKLDPIKNSISALEDRLSKQELALFTLKADTKDHFNHIKRQLKELKEDTKFLRESQNSTMSFYNREVEKLSKRLDKVEQTINL